jgi:dienelactone hydrolase
VAARRRRVSPLRAPSLALLLAVLGLAACVSPARRTDREAARLGLARQEVRGAAFLHVVYRDTSRPAGADRLLHVYLGGDGSPRQAMRWIPRDPTPTTPVALRLMALDPAPHVFLGRPCQHGVGRADSGGGCSPRDWTTHRYGPEIVESLVAALRSLSVAQKAPGIVLLGYSGGGSLAMLMAARMPEVRAVVTVAANLDVRGWAALHGYAPLDASLSPAEEPALDPGVAQIHVLGARDHNVPPALVEAALARQPPGVRVRIVTAADHACCWEAAWPSVLADLDALLGADQKN